MSLSFSLLGSLKQPSRRRPVSVDYDGKKGPGAGGLGLLHKVGGAQVDSNRMSYYSNRSSQPLTDREVEQGFQYYNQKDKGTIDFDEMCAMYNYNNSLISDNFVNYCPLI